MRQRDSIKAVCVQLIIYVYVYMYNIIFFGKAKHYYGVSIRDKTF